MQGILPESGCLAEQSTGPKISVEDIQQKNTKSQAIVLLSRHSPDSIFEERLWALIGIYRLLTQYIGFRAA